MKSTTKQYRRRRDFRHTPEPEGAPARDHEGSDRTFVIHKHDSRQLHYDLRLEADGVLKSWVVPEGPSTDPRQPRLALQMEDHPLEYADFEGVIPEDEYGGGTVLVWEQGTYENITDRDGEPVPVTEALEAGHLVVRLHGKKLQGGYALLRTDDGAQPRWLLVKTKDDDADARRNPVSTQGRSVLSGRTLDEVRSEAGSP